MELFDKDDITQLDTIEASHPGDAETCCKKMLKLWVEKYPEATWNDLIESLKARGVELRETASKIEGMLLPPGMFVNSNCHINILCLLVYNLHSYIARSYAVFWKPYHFL